MRMLDDNFGLVPSKHTNTVEGFRSAYPSEMMAIGDVFEQRPALTRESVYGLALLAYQRHQGHANVVFCDATLNRRRCDFS